MSTITKDLGVVTAYGYAVTKGYEGTEEEFAELMASYATVAEQAAQSAETAEGAAQAAAQAVLDANAAKTSAQQSAASAGNSASAASGSASSASQSASAAQTSAEYAAGSAQSASQSAEAANTAKTDAQTAQGKAEEAQEAAEEAAQEAVTTLENKANIDGSYESMTVGNAEQLVGTVGNEDSVPYNFRTSGGGIDIGDREEDMVVGGTICWHQHALKNLAYFEELNVTKQISANEVTIVSTTDNTAVKGVFKRLAIGHVYYLCAAFETATDSLAAIGFRRGGVTISDGTITMGWESHSSYARMERIALCSQSEDIAGCFLQNDTLTGGSATFKDVQFFDLTKMFGSAVANHIHNLEAARLGDGVAFFKKLFPKDYYEYNEGELMSVKTSAHKMVGFNAWDEEWEVGTIDSNTGNNYTDATRIRSKNMIKVIPGQTYFVTGARIKRYYYNSNGEYIGNEDAFIGDNASFTIPDGVSYIRFITATTYGTAYKNVICINLSWDGERDGEYEEYEEHVYPLDSSLELRGIPKLDSANNLYYDGDTYESDGTVTRKYGVVELTGAEQIIMDTTTGFRFFDVTIGTKKAVQYLRDNTMSNVLQNTIEKNSGVRYQFNYSGDLRIMDDLDGTYQTVADLRSYLTTAYNNGNPITIIYELATPTTETAEPYQNPQIVNDFGTEEYVDERAVPIPVGHQTKYLANLRAKLEMSPDSPSADGEYIVKQTNGKNEYIALGSSTTMQSIMAKLPYPPSEDGTYTLKVTVANGTATYSWGA